MKLSTRARYGTRLMLELALHYGNGPVLLKDIARVQAISEKYLGQLIITLKANKLVSSQRGAKGGYSLSRPPGKIRLDEVVGVLEGDLDLVPCSVAAGCSRAAGCVTRDLWMELNRKVVETLHGQTLADLVRKQAAKQKKFIYNI